MRIAICDDEAYYREEVYRLVNEYALENKMEEITAFVFTHAEELIEAINKSGPFDIYLLDVVMPGMNGIELGKYLRENGFNEKIIYLTTSDEYAVASYRVNASDYILKPYKEDEVISALERVIRSVSDRKDRSIIVKTKDGSVKLSFDNVLYAELVKRVVVYHLKGGREVESLSVRTNFGDTVKELVADGRFAYCGKSILLNLHHVSEVESEAVIFNDGRKIIAGKKLCREVHTAWLDLCFGEVN